MKTKEQLLKANKKLSQEEYLWHAEKQLIQRKNKIINEKSELKQNYLFNIHISTSKLLIAFLFLSCTAIEIFTGYVTIEMLKVAKENMAGFDFTPLVTLIGAVVGEVVGYAVYSAKAVKENVAGGITYDLAMQDNNFDDTVG